MNKGTPILRWLLVPLLVVLSAVHGYSQQGLVVNVDMLDGVDITPASIFNFQVINSSGSVQNAQFTGTLHYRGSSLRLGYTFRATLQPGVNQLSRDKATSLSWTWSDGALRDLFLTYGRLPQGSYEYCVSVSVSSTGHESQPPPAAEGCVYNKSEDLFLITLVDPENKAKLYEQYPMLSWAVTSPLAGELTYRVRVAELKKGQNAVNAITRNPPMYEERNVMGNSIQYPVTARPLEKWQPYVWTVDAYYHGLLLGGAETWQFIIVDDSELVAVPREQSYYEFAAHHGDTRLYAVGQLKLKYISEQMGDSLQLQLYTADKNEIKLPAPVLAVTPGINYLQLDMSEKITLTHGKNYSLVVTDKAQHKYLVPFTYVNPLFLK